MATQHETYHFDYQGEPFCLYGMDEEQRSFFLEDLDDLSNAAA